MIGVIPIWSYYGRKSKVINYYPEPLYDIIIEPFAGTAVYALNNCNWEKDVILIDKYEVITRVWKYLQQSKPEHILQLPDIKKGDTLDNYKQLCEEERWLIGFCIHRGSESPRRTATAFNSWNSDKLNIASNLHKIKHWNIINGDYKDIVNIKATWFIDPPYQNGGKYYKYNEIDYKQLSIWCQDRRGQVIVCENTKADWLPFMPIKSMRGQMYRTTEAIWYRDSINGIRNEKLYG